MNTMSTLLPKTNTNPMKTILTKCAVAVGVGVCLYLLAFIFGTEHYWCFKDQDTCAVEEMNHYRNVRDEKLKQENEQHMINVTAINAYYNDKKINPLKVTLSAGAVIKEAKEGDRRNIPEELLTLKNVLVPIAQADNGDGWTQDVEIKDQSSITKDQSTEKTLRYQAVLNSVGSPYANIDIESGCNTAGVTEYQCDILVAIAQSESGSGNNFKSDFLARDEAINLGQNFYHNPVGIKDLRPKEERERSHPDENGMYLRRFESWEAFWQWYPSHMKAAYFDRGGSTPAIISKCYVRGDCKITKPSWVHRVESFISKI